MDHTSITANKDKYKVRNWKAYNKSLCHRGRITLWIEDSVMKDWSFIDITKKSVGECLYPDSVIRCCLLLKLSYHLCLRQATGFVESLLFFMGKGHYAVPDYSTLSRGQSLIPGSVSQRLTRGENLDIAIDST